MGGGSFAVPLLFVSCFLLGLVPLGTVSDMFPVACTEASFLLSLVLVRSSIDRRSTSIVFGSLSFLGNMNLLVHSDSSLSLSVSVSCPRPGCVHPSPVIM